MNEQSESNAALKHIVFFWSDLSRIGGISRRIANTLNNAGDRRVRYHSVSLTNVNDLDHPANTVVAKSAARLEAKLGEFDPDTTVLVMANTVARSVRKLTSRLADFPLVHTHAGQMAWFVQNNVLAADIDFVQWYRANASIAMSRGDVAFQRQLGLMGQHVVCPPCIQRAENPYDTERNTRIGYVGRIDYATKGADLLIPVARTMRERGMPPLLIYTTDGRNSPDYATFMETLEADGVADAVEIVVGVTDPNELYGRLSFLLAPSRKEAFGNAVLEACSFGVPVITNAYAPGPAEIVTDGISGALVETFDPETVLRATSIDADARRRLSEGAFARHRDFNFPSYYAALERVAAIAIRNHAEGKSYAVYPELRMATDPMNAMLRRADRRRRPLRRALQGIERLVRR